MIHRPIAPLLLSAVVAIVAPRPTTTPQARLLAITHVTAIDVATGRIAPDTTVIISGSSIAGISKNGSPPAGARVVDAGGRFLVPGLWDMHAHMEDAGAPSLQLYVANGVTGIRDMGSSLDVILPMRENTASGRTLGPRIYAAGPILDDAPDGAPFRMRVRTAEEGRGAVEYLRRRGVDLVKIHGHTPREAFFAIADAARRQNLPLAGHVPMGLSVEEVVDAGQRDIEHLNNLQVTKRCGGEHYQPARCQPFFAMLASRGVWQTPTLAALSELVTIGTPVSRVGTDRLVYAGRAQRAAWAGNQSLVARPDVLRAMRTAADRAARVAADMTKAGVGLLAGCDGLIAGFCVHDELAAMVRGGMTPLAALQTATLNPARYFGLEETSGRIAAGHRADLVLLNANPLADIASVGRIHAVVLGGRLLDRRELDEVLAEVRAAASR